MLVWVFSAWFHIISNIFVSVLGVQKCMLLIFLLYSHRYNYRGIFGKHSNWSRFCLKIVYRSNTEKYTILSYKKNLFRLVSSSRGGSNSRIPGERKR